MPLVCRWLIGCWLTDLPCESVRRYFCATCRAEVYVCSPCDRGQRYCREGCAPSARRRSTREANRRYQRTLCGRLLHAERSRRYRLRRKIVTDHGSPAPIDHDVLPASATKTVLAPSSTVEITTAPPAAETAVDAVSSAARVRCHFCGNWYDSWIRHTPLRRRSSRPRSQRRHH